MIVGVTTNKGKYTQTEDVEKYAPPSQAFPYWTFWFYANKVDDDWYSEDYPEFKKHKGKAFEKCSMLHQDEVRTVEVFEEVEEDGTVSQSEVSDLRSKHPARE